MHGNVWDWTDDCWNETNAGNPGDGTARTIGDCTWRVVRGGAWNYGPTYLRAAFRYWNVPHNRSGVQSFRVARTLWRVWPIGWAYAACPSVPSMCRRISVAEIAS